MWKKYSSELCIGVVVINLAFTAWALTQVKQQIASLRQGAAGSQQISPGFPSGFGAPATEKPTGEGVAVPSAGMPAIPPEVEKQLKEMNARTPPAPVLGATGDPGVPPPGEKQVPVQEDQVPAQKEQPKKK